MTKDTAAFIKSIMDALANEILWCEHNPDRALSTEYRKGFTNGLVQARYLIGEVKRTWDSEATK